MIYASKNLLIPMLLTLQLNITRKELWGIISLTQTNMQSLLFLIT